MKSASDRVKMVIMEQFYLDADRVDMNASIRDDLGADSLDCVELVMGVEEEFGVEIPEEDVGGMKTGADMVAWLEKNVDVESSSSVGDAHPYAMYSIAQEVLGCVTGWEPSVRLLGNVTAKEMEVMVRDYLKLRMAAGIVNVEGYYE